MSIKKILVAAVLCISAIGAEQYQENALSEGQGVEIEQESEQKMESNFDQAQQELLQQIGEKEGCIKNAKSYDQLGECVPERESPLRRGGE